MKLSRLPNISSACTLVTVYNYIHHYVDVSNAVDFWWLILPFETVGIVTLILALFCLHFYHLAIRKKIERIRETLDELTMQCGAKCSLWVSSEIATKIGFTHKLTV